MIKWHVYLYPVCESSRGQFATCTPPHLVHIRHSAAAEMIWLRASEVWRPVGSLGLCDHVFLCICSLRPACALSHSPPSMHLLTHPSLHLSPSFVVFISPASPLFCPPPFHQHSLFSLSRSEQLSISSSLSTSFLNSKKQFLSLCQSAWQ